MKTVLQQFLILCYARLANIYKQVSQVKLYKCWEKCEALKGALIMLIKSDDTKNTISIDESKMDGVILIWI